MNGHQRLFTGGLIPTLTQTYAEMTSMLEWVMLIIGTVRMD